MFRNINRINLTLFLLYFSGICILSFFHEFWRDELQTYMLVKSSNSISELFYNCRYEGHPSLWFMVLYALKCIAPGLLPMKILHLLIAALTGWLIINYSPFKTAQKALLLFGYFFFYEYAFIVRNYALGLLFIIVFCLLFTHRESPRHFIFLALSVVGMMLSNFYSFFIGFALVVLLAAEHFFYNRNLVETKKLLPGYALMMAGIILFVIDSIPPADYGYAYKLYAVFDTEDLINTFARVWQVFVPIPKSTVQFWNSSIIEGSKLQALFGIVIIALVVVVFAQKGLSRLFIVLCFIIILSFSYLKFSGYLRHNGHLYIAFIVMLWLQHYLPGKEIRLRKSYNVSLYILLSLHAVAMLFALKGEITYPFSQAKNTAAYIDKQYKNRLIVANLDVGASSVSAFLDTSIYYPSSNTFATYITWNRKRVGIPATSFVVNKGDSLAHLYQKEILYLFTFPVDSSEYYGLHLQKSFTPSVEVAESYYLYIK